MTFEIRSGVVGFEGRTLVRNVNLKVLRGERIGILGGNGTGKTTLLRSLLQRVPLLRGEMEWGPNHVPAYFAQEARFSDAGRSVFDYVAELNPAWTDLELRKLAALFLFKEDDIHKPVMQLSGGERSRLWLVRLFAKASNVLILDEPTNHLDIRSREVLEAALRNYSGSLIAVSHDRYFLRKVVDRFYLIRDGYLTPVRNVDQVAEELAVPSLGGDRSEKPAPQKRTRTGLSKNERMRRERRMAEIETETDQLERDKAEIEDKLQNQVEDHTLLHQLSQELHALEIRVSALYHEWEEIGSALEKTQ